MYRKWEVPELRNPNTNSKDQRAGSESSKSKLGRKGGEGEVRWGEGRCF